MRVGSSSRDAIGHVMTWLCGGTLALDLLLITGLAAVLAVNGASHFWPRPLVELRLAGGAKLLGAVVEREAIPDDPNGGYRIRVHVGNRDLGGQDFRWIDEREIASRGEPADAVALERLEWGAFYGRMVALRRAETVLAQGQDAARAAFEPLHEAKRAELAAIEELERGEIARSSAEIERLRLAARRLELSESSGAERAASEADLAGRSAAANAAYERAAARLSALRESFLAETVELEAADGTRKEIPVGHVVRVVRPNELGMAGRFALAFSRAAEFVSGVPRESNTEGGIFPAIFGTVLMVFLMAIVVAPFGVLAAIYLREYAKEGLLVRGVRIAVNNLAGVPSIVFGVFGLGFFVYGVGGSIDRLLFAEALPAPTFGTGGILWASLTLALLTVPVVIVASEEGLAAVPNAMREGSLALGATRLETLVRVVVPAAAPGILTGVILAMARAAGEVAPLMIVGMVKLAPALPVDGAFPFVHLERKFMHLGFHVYDVGFQSPNVEAVKPLVFATALLLVLVVVATNLAAILLRNRLRSRLGPRSIG
ncbi:MAG: phosphate ABC transporter permease PstA [Deltaproteobacteria bacterium]|nr:phosphate ABC transporter permease PstA [Deltaproteobacteria bacterium]